jgi:uncharacterized protein
LTVLISEALRDKDPETVILFIVSQPDIEWIVTPEILAEYKAVLGRPKFNFPEAVKRKWLDLLNETTLLAEVGEKPDFPRDRKDAIFLAGALAIDADFFLTGDHDFSEAHKLIHTTIIPVALFKKLICSHRG